MGIKEDWQRGISYEDLHIKYMAPAHNCGCEACDRGRSWERAEEALAEEVQNEMD